MDGWNDGTVLTREKLFSICGKVVGHYPIVGWARVACSYIKRVAEGKAWKDPVGGLANKMCIEMMTRIEQGDDPVKGKWVVESANSGRVWTDASSLALGVLLEIGGYAVEDAAWLRKKTDVMHINISELEAALKGLNLAIKWELKQVELMVDSKTVYDWINLTLSGDRRIKTKGAAEMLIKRKLAVFAETIAAYDIEVKMTLVTSGENKADILTRVPNKWLVAEKRLEASVALAVSGSQNREERLNVVKTLHNKHHMGVDRSCN